MKKTLLFLSALFLMLNPAVSNAGTFGVGFSISDADLDTVGKEDVDTDGTTDATKTVSDTATIGSFFAEYTMMGVMDSRLGIILGVDLIPGEADITKRSVTQSSVKADPGTVVTGTNSVEGTLENAYTLYIQPGIAITDSTMIYGTIGYSSVDFNGRSVSISSTDINSSQNITGDKVGVGVKHVLDSGFFIKADYSETDYDVASFTTSNNTTATADLDMKSYGISVGKHF
jgi:opacity protein-like surface antigen